MNSFLTLALVAGLAPVAFANSTGMGGNTASVPVPACAVIYAPVTIGEIGPWNFGTLALNSFAPFSVHMDKFGMYGGAVNCATYNGTHKVPVDVPWIGGLKDYRLDLCFTATTATLKGKGFGAGTLTLTPDSIPNIKAGLPFFFFPLTGTLSGKGTGVGSYSGTVTVTACYL